MFLVLPRRKCAIRLEFLSPVGENPVCQRSSQLVVLQSMGFEVKRTQFRDLTQMIALCPQASVSPSVNGTMTPALQSFSPWCIVGSLQKSETGSWDVPWEFLGIHILESYLNK